MDDEQDNEQGTRQSTDEPAESGALEDEQEGKGYGAGGREQMDE
jgi:hypothetical protein